MGGEGGVWGWGAGTRCTEHIDVRMPGPTQSVPGLSTRQQQARSPCSPPAATVTAPPTAPQPQPATPCAAGQAAAGPAGLARQARLLAVLVRCITTVGLLAAAFGPAYSHLALLLLYGKRWADTEAPVALGLYSQYLALLAANGILEAFVHSVATERQLHANNVALVGFTAVHAGLSVAAVRSGGAAGLIAADAASMALRIAYCLRFAAARFAGTPAGFRPRQLLPNGATAGALAASAAVTSASRLILMSDSSALLSAAGRHGLQLQLLPPAVAYALARQPAAVLAAAHVGVGAACLALVAATMLRHERSLVSEMRQLRKGSKSQ